MKWGLAGAILWALDTVILSIALSATIFTSTAEAIALASFVSTFFHDTAAAIFMWIFNGVRGKMKKAFNLLKSKPGKLVLVAALLGGPVGMSGYVFAVSQIGAAYTSAISAFYPAFGALLAHFFLKDRLKWYQWIGLVVCMSAIAVVGFNPDEGVPGNWALGVTAALLAVFGWGSEANIISYALRFGEADEECCLQIRYTTSALVYAIIIMPVVGGYAFAGQVLFDSALPIIALAGCCGAASYTCYYTAIHKIGAAKGMAINVSYSGWTIPISFILLGTIPTTVGIVCAIVIIIGAIMAATDVKELFSKNNKQLEDGGKTTK